MSRVEPLVLRVGDEQVLREWVRSSTITAGLAQRARIVLLAAEGNSNAEVARLVGVSLPTVHSWRSRYSSGGLTALDDLPRSGRPAVHDEQTIIAATLDRPPAKLGVTHWSARLLGDHLEISFATVARVWRRWGLKPWKAETFKFSTDPELEAKIRDVVGLYLAPPAKAVVVCIDEKTQIQALDRTAPILPLRPGVPEKQTHDYKRNGTTTLFAALEVATGLVTDRCFQQHTNKEFLAFLKQVARAYPRVALHVVCDNYATKQASQRCGLAGQAARACESASSAKAWRCCSRSRCWVVASEFAHQDISDDDIALAVAGLEDDPADDGLWFFHAGGVPMWFGYTLGYRWARDYAAARGIQASDLVHTSATAIAGQATN